MITPAQIHLARSGQAASGAGRPAALSEADRTGVPFARRFRTRRTQR